MWCHTPYGVQAATNWWGGKAYESAAVVWTVVDPAFVAGQTTLIDRRVGLVVSSAQPDTG